jgi:hypothetical protein
MKFSFGKYIGKPIPWVIIEDPDYIDWFLSQNMTSRQEHNFTQEIIRKFDNAPFTTVRCMSGINCTNQVDFLSLYNGRYNGDYWFCQSCGPDSLGALPNKVSTINKYQQTARMNNRKDVIKSFAYAKGIPKIKTEKALKKFFNYS